MPNPTIQDSAYTAVGINLLVADKAIETASDISSQMVDRLGPIGENVQDVIDRAEEIVRKAGDELDELVSLSAEMNKARKQARKQATAWRKSVDPMAEQFESRLPEDVAAFLADQRSAAWSVVGATKPAVKKTTAKKTTAKKTTARKTTARKPTAKKS